MTIRQPILRKQTGMLADFGNEALSKEFWGTPSSPNKLMQEEESPTLPLQKMSSEEMSLIKTSIVEQEFGKIGTIVYTSESGEQKNQSAIPLCSDIYH